jgi:glyoxylase-like metal-dependent hydrolase (beta-lactamase superfamily II)
MIKIKKFVVNPLGENSYIISDETGECIFVDPGFYYDEEHDEVRDYIKSNNLTPVKITNTHCHFDHIMGVEFVRNEYRIPFFAHPDDAFWIEKAIDQGKMFGFEMKPVAAADAFFVENEFVEFGNTKLKIIHVPGHSPGHVVFYSEPDKKLIAGDVLFYGSIGRTDLPGGDYETLISNIKNKLFDLPDDTVVYSGHGPETTIGFEKRTNPFLT